MRGDTVAFPRLLFITSAAFNRSTGGGITFSNLFRGWPKDRLATIHNDPIPVTTDVCERYYRLGAEEISTWPILHRLRERAAARGGGEGVVAGAPRPGFLPRIKRAIFGDGLPERGRLSPRLHAWVAEFRPEIVYTILGGIGLMQVIGEVRQRFSLPLAVHFMDDWQAAIHRGGLLSPLQRRQMRRLIAGLVDAAQERLGICDAMCADYARRYGQPFRPFQNTIDVARWGALAKRDLAVGSPLRLLYTGSILAFAQAESLVDCCEAVAALSAQGFPVTLDIYSPAAQSAPLRERLQRSAAIRLNEVITDDGRYFKTLAAADILLLPVNFDAHSQRYIRLSMPTKVPSYLVSGTPVLTYGPPGVAQIEYAREAGWGFLVERRDPATLAAAIRRLAVDLALRQRLAATARQVATARHDSAMVRGSFQAVLAAAAHPSIPAKGP